MTELKEPQPSETITHEVVYPFPPEKVWRALTEKDLLAQWLMPNNFKPIVGYKFQFREVPASGWSGVVECEILEIDKPMRLVYSWQGGANMPRTRVTWILERIPSGTRLRLEHTGLTGSQGKIIKDTLGPGWGSKLREKLPEALKPDTGSIREV